MIAGHTRVITFTTGLESEDRQEYSSRSRGIAKVNVKYLLARFLAPRYWVVGDSNERIAAVVRESKDSSSSESGYMGMGARGVCSH